MDEQSAPQKLLTYEETPVIEPIKETPPVVQPNVPPMPQMPKSTPSFLRRFFGFIGNILFFVVLFAIGVGLGAFLPQLPGRTETTNLPAVGPTPTLEPKLVATQSSEWKSYQIISSSTKQPVAGVSFQLPPDVLAPVCDGTSCVSQGTYLPGGTRFTVATRTTSLQFMRTAIITDASGQAFTQKEATVSGNPAIEYSGSFRGTTTGGYTFTQMRGAMIEASPSLTLELNHFAPVGATVDFTADDTLFDKILKTIELPTSTPSARLP